MTPLLIVLLVVLVAIIAIPFLARRFPRFTETAAQGPWLGAYLAARDRGASPRDAIIAAVEPLRYRYPFNRLSEKDVESFAEILAECRKPEVFTQVLFEAQQNDDMSLIRDTAHLKGFVAFMNESGT